MKIRCKLVENFRSIVDNTRGHSVVLDLPPTLGGEDTGPTALELAVMGLAGCIVTIFSVVAKKMRVQIDELEVIVDAEKPSDAKTITEIKTVINVKTPESKVKIEKIWARTHEICPVGIIFEKAGLKLEPEINVTK